MYPEECIDRRPAVADRSRSEATGRLPRLLRTWLARSRQRRQLLQLDARLYRDIGVTADEVRREARKPFWRA